MAGDATQPVAFMGTNGGVCFAEQGFDRALRGIGLNTGNVMFQYAMWQRIRNPKIGITPGTSLDGLKGKVKALVIPAANQINPAWDLGGWAETVEALDVPVVIAGLGAQAEIGADPALDIKPGTLRFLKAVAERADHIGVRGQFTQDVLNRLGIANTVVIGCPSQFINSHITGAGIAERLARVRENPPHRVGHLFGTMEAGAREAERVLFEIGRQHRARIIYQTNPDVLAYIFNGELSPRGRDYLAWESQILSPGIARDEYNRIIKWNGMFFSDARSWIDAMAAFDVVIGMRIHGAIAAIQGGSLGVCVAFDARTLELVETMKYPHLHHGAVRPDDTLATLLDRVVFDPAVYEATRATLRARFEALARRSDLEFDFEG